MNKHVIILAALHRAGLAVEPGWLSGPGGMRWQHGRIVRPANPRRAEDRLFKAEDRRRTA